MIFIRLLFSVAIITEGINILEASNVDKQGIEFVPYLVSLQRTKNGRHKCGGVIINNKTILTAAHCVAGVKRNEMYVKAGVTKLSEPGKILHPRRIISNKNYLFRKDHDIAVIKLRSAIEFNDAMRSIELEESGNFVSAGSEALLSGWGYAGSKIGFPDHLKIILTEVVDQKKCKTILEERNVTEVNICVGVNGASSCRGDSGGPMVVNNKLVGIMSWTVHCGLQGDPSVYVRIASLRPWIDRIVRDY